jgi:hypothetical protein
MLSCLLVLVLAAPPAEGRDPFHWKVPGLVSTLEVPSRMSVEGMPLRLQVYTSREPVERLLQYFATAFDEAGFYLQRHQRRLAAQPHLTALDTRTFTSYTVLLEPEPGGLTTVVLGEAKLNEPAPARADTLPVYPGAMNVLHGDFEGARTLAFRAPAKVEQVGAWYREGLKGAGYKEEAPLLFRREEQEVRLSLSQEGGWVQAVLFFKTALPEPPPERPQPPAAGSHP